MVLEWYWKSETSKALNTGSKCFGILRYWNLLSGYMQKRKTVNSKNELQTTSNPLSSFVRSKVFSDVGELIQSIGVFFCIESGEYKYDVWSIWLIREKSFLLSKVFQNVLWSVFAHWQCFFLYWLITEPHLISIMAGAIYVLLMLSLLSQYSVLYALIPECVSFCISNDSFVHIMSFIVRRTFCFL